MNERKMIFREGKKDTKMFREEMRERKKDIYIYV